MLKCFDFGVGLKLLLQRVPAARAHHHEDQAAAGQGVLLSPCVFILHLWMLLVSFSSISSNEVHESGQAAIKNSWWEEAEKGKCECWVSPDSWQMGCRLHSPGFTGREAASACPCEPGGDCPGEPLPWGGGRSLPQHGNFRSFLQVAQAIGDCGSASSLCSSCARGKARAMPAFPILMEVRVKQQLCPGSGSRNLEAKAKW